ncbi:MAG TPA: hypothetical protein PKA05_13225 [Roseiflexaceae bacterium]|nr:hypothetical protein [Roseiflexaceae bacterium]HMP41339.1 hypothetical protein [Roseiflexaceae bacterium]
MGLRVGHWTYALGAFPFPPSAIDSRGFVVQVAAGPSDMAQAGDLPC